MTVERFHKVKEGVGRGQLGQRQGALNRRRNIEGGNCMHNISFLVTETQVRLYNTMVTCMYMYMYSYILCIYMYMYCVYERFYPHIYVHYALHYS